MIQKFHRYLDNQDIYYDPKDLHSVGVLYFSHWVVSEASVDNPPITRDQWVQIFNVGLQCFDTLTDVMTDIANAAEQFDDHTITSDVFDEMFFTQVNAQAVKSSSTITCIKYKDKVAGFIIKASDGHFVTDIDGVIDVESNSYEHCFQAVLSSINFEVHL